MLSQRVGGVGSCIVAPVIELSVAAPVFNEAEGIERVVRHWRAVLDGAGIAAEIVTPSEVIPCHPTTHPPGPMGSP